MSSSRLLSREVKATRYRELARLVRQAGRHDFAQELEMLANAIERCETAAQASVLSEPRERYAAHDDMLTPFEIERLRNKGRGTMALADVVFGTEDRLARMMAGLYERFGSTLRLH